MSEATVYGGLAHRRRDWARRGWPAGGTNAAMGNWNFADIWEVAADELPDVPCLIHGDDHRTWAEVDRRADGVAQAAARRRPRTSAGRRAVLVQLQRVHGIDVCAAFKGSFVPVNTNYRYTADELLYLWDNADAGAVVFHGSFADTIEVDPRSALQGQALAVGRRRQRRCPTGQPRTKTRPPAAPAGSPQRGVAAATTSTSSTPVAPPACRRASCGARTTWR